LRQQQTGPFDHSDLYSLCVASSAAAMSASVWFG
jgi:hypothetical protein